MKPVLILLLLLSACTHPTVSPVIPPPAPNPVVSPSPIPEPILLPPIIVRGGVKFYPMIGFATESEKAAIAKAGPLMTDVVQSKCFFDFMANRQMRETDGRTSIEVAKHLQSLSGPIPVVMYTRCIGKIIPCSTAIAYRVPPSDTINLNRNKFNSSANACTWAGTLGHESLGHTLGGYGHSFKWTPTRDSSVPYSIAGAAGGNDAFGKCCICKNNGCAAAQ